MKYQTPLKWLILLITVLALISACMGLFYQSPGTSFPYTNHRGETVMVNGHGLYYWDTVSTAAQMQGNDLVTLLVGIPLLVGATWYAFRKSFRAHLLLTGTLGFFLYTYMSMSMLTAYNALFLVYVALFSLSLVAFILTFLAFDFSTLPRHFAKDFPRRSVASLLCLIGSFLLLAWLGRIIPPLVSSQTPALENTTTLVIQAMDLGLIVPLAFVSAVLILRRNVWGYLLSSIFVMKAITMGLAVSTMSINMTLAGTPESLGIMIPFIFVTVVNLVVAFVLFRSVQDDRILSLPV